MSENKNNEGVQAEPNVNIVLRTALAQVPDLEWDRPSRDISKVLVVPTPFATYACATDSKCMAVVEVEGEASEEATLDLAALQQIAVKTPQVINRTGDHSEIFRGFKCDPDHDEWKPIGPVFQVKDKSSASNFIPTRQVVQPAKDNEEFIVVRLDVDLLRKVAMALLHDGDKLRVCILIPKSGDVDKIRIQTNHGIGLLMPLEREYGPSDTEVVGRFNAVAKKFSEGREEAEMRRRHHEWRQEPAVTAKAQPEEKPEPAGVS